MVSNKKKKWFRDFKFKDFAFINGEYKLIRETETEKLEQLIENIEQLPSLTKKQKVQKNLLEWIVFWRDNDTLFPKTIRYSPSVWNLEDITEYNYPENIFELGVLYREAIKKASIEKIKLLRAIIKKKGYKYTPRRIVDGEMRREEFETKVDCTYTDEEMAILTGRGLI